MAQHSRLADFPAVEDFAAVTNAATYAPVPDDWLIGVTDVVRSTEAVASGRYKAVNMAGAAAISAVMNALGTREFPFAFGGDGCAFVLPKDDEAAARTALSETAAFVRDDMDLTLRTALVPVSAVRADGADVRVAFYRPTQHVAYAMFDGGGIAKAEDMMKAGHHAVPPGPDGARPDLSGLSCRWRPIKSRKGEILSIIARPGPLGDDAFRKAATGLLALLGETVAHPVPDDGPTAAFLSPGIKLEALASRKNEPTWRRMIGVTLHNVMGWLLFATGIKVGGFDPQVYRAFASRNADARKFGDGLLLTADCTEAQDATLTAYLDEASAEGALRYGIHRQDAALMTCIVPSHQDHGHFHFIDGAGGGYTAAAKALRTPRTN